MDLRFIFGLFVVITLSSSAHIPAVYENVQKFESNPKIFDFEEYQKVTQQNPQTVRYQQQQESDKQHINRQARFLQSEISDHNEATNQEPAVKVPAQNSWKVIHPKFVNENPKENSSLISIKRNQEKRDVKIDRVPINSEDSKKGLKADSYFVNKEVVKSAQKEDRQDIGTDFILVNSNDIASANSKIVHQNLGGFSESPHQDTHIQALNSLIGQTPTLQLQGLHQLLNPIANKDHVPIQEDIIDIPNTQSKPNIKVQHAPNKINNGIQAFADQNPAKFKSLQAQLDATANAHAESIIAEAQQKAFEHVKAQHAALAMAQVEAERKALAEIEAQNRELARIHSQAEAQRLAHVERELEAQKEAEALKNAEREHVKKIAIEEEKRLNERRRQEKAKEYAKANVLDDVATVAQKTRIYTQKHRKQHQLQQYDLQQQLQPQSSQTQNIYSQVSEVHQPNFQALIQPQPFHHQPTYHPQNVDLVETKVIYQHLQPVKNIPKGAHTQADNLEQPQSNTYQHLKPHPPQYSSYGKGNEQEAEVTKYYIPPQITAHEGKNIHGENELQYAAKYAFGYRIRDQEHGNDFGHSETKNGDTTKGHYHVLLPDGRVQNVNYYVDPSGYHAKVTYGSSAENLSEKY